MSLADKPIYPCEVRYFEPSYNEKKSFKDSGMTYRQWLSGLAMQAIVTNDKANDLDSVEQVALLSVKLAEALIAQLEKEDK